jgi:hypothetical protein
MTMTNNNTNNNEVNMENNTEERNVQCPYCGQLETSTEYQECEEAYEWAKKEIARAERGVLYCGPEREYYIDN